MKRRTLLKTWSLSALALIQPAHAATKTIALSCAAPAWTATPFYRASELVVGGLQSHWLPRAQAGEALQLTLCGERAAQRFVTPPPSLLRRLHRTLSQALRARTAI